MVFPVNGCLDTRRYLSPPVGRFSAKIAYTILLCQIWEFITNICESAAKDVRKLCERSRSLRQVLCLAHSNSLFLSKLTKWREQVAAWVLWMFTQRFSLQTQTYSSHFPRESPAKDDHGRIRARKQTWWSRKVLPKMKWNGHLVLSTAHVFSYFCRWPIPQHPGQARTWSWRTTGDVFSSF